jgi:hypothetical protein
MFDIHDWGVILIHTHLLRSSSMFSFCQSSSHQEDEKLLSSTRWIGRCLFFGVHKPLVTLSVGQNRNCSLIVGDFILSMTTTRAEPAKFVGLHVDGHGLGASSWLELGRKVPLRCDGRRSKLQTHGAITTCQSYMANRLQLCSNTCPVVQQPNTGDRPWLNIQQIWTTITAL